MRIAVAVNEDLSAAARIRAVEEGRTISSILDEALESYLDHRRGIVRTQVPDLPVFDGGAVLPGVDLDVLR